MKERPQFLIASLLAAIPVAGLLAALGLLRMVPEEFVITASGLHDVPVGLAALVLLVAYLAVAAGLYIYTQALYALHVLSRRVVVASGILVPAGSLFAYILHKAQTLPAKAHVSPELFGAWSLFAGAGYLSGVLWWRAGCRGRTQSARRQRPGRARGEREPGKP